MFTLADGIELCLKALLDNASSQVPDNSFLKYQTSFGNKTAEEILYLVWSYAWCQNSDKTADALKTKVLMSLGEIRSAYYHLSYDDNPSISCAKGALERLLDTIAADDLEFKKDASAGNPTEVFADRQMIIDCTVKTAKEISLKYLLDLKCSVDILKSCCEDKDKSDKDKSFSISSELWPVIREDVLKSVTAQCGENLSATTIKNISDVFSGTDDSYQYIYIELTEEERNKLCLRLSEGSSSSTATPLIISGGPPSVESNQSVDDQSACFKLNDLPKF
jgi:hypothetical protein